MTKMRARIILAAVSIMVLAMVPVRVFADDPKQGLAIFVSIRTSVAELTRLSSF